MICFSRTSLLTIGECHCEDEARKVVENMLNQVHVVGEGIIGSALVSGKCQWISDDDSFSLVQTCNAENLGLFQRKVPSCRAILGGNISS